MNIVNGRTNLENLKELLRALTYAELLEFAETVYDIAPAFNTRDLADAINDYARTE